MSSFRVTGLGEFDALKKKAEMGGRVIPDSYFCCMHVSMLTQVICHVCKHL